MIKRNVSQYNEQRASFLNSPTNAEKKFKNIKKKYNQLIADRRSQSTIISKFVRSGDIENLDQRIIQYRAAVDAWNGQYREMANSIVRATDCKSVTERRRSEIQQNMLENFQNASKLHNKLFLQMPDLQSVLIADFIAANNVCPTYFLTQHKPDDSQPSVHDVFRKMNKGIFSFRNHAFNACRLRHLNNLSHYYRRCASNIQKAQEFAACTSYFDDQIKKGEFCSRGTYEQSNYKIDEVEFQKLDLYWNLGNLLMNEYRRSFTLNECHSIVGFWGRNLDWNCVEYIDRNSKL